MTSYTLTAHEATYKVLGPNRESYHGGTTVVWTPGEWMPEVKGKLKPCHRGYHLCRRADLVNWLGPTIWIAEYEGDRIDVDSPRDQSKVVVRRARIVEPLNWNERVMRLFACDCAEQVLSIIERDAPDERRPRQAIEVARRFANGEATQEELSAARAAAWAAAWAAARDAAWDAARDWQTERLLYYLEKGK